MNPNLAQLVVKRISGGAVLYWLGIILVFFWAGFIRFRLPSWPLADLDIWGYLRPAVAKLGGHGFQHSNARNFLYPGFLLLILSATKTFRSITVVQHLLGLGTGALLILSWNKIRRFLHAIPSVVHYSLGIALAAVYLLANLPVRYEHQLRPEAITPFFAILNILLTLRFLELRDRQGPSAALTLTGALVLANSILLATLKTSFGLTALIASVPVFFALFDRRENWLRRMAIVATGVACSAAVILPERVLAKSDPGAQNFLRESLFSIHANLIARQVDEDAARNDCGPYPCEWLRELATSLHEEMGRSWESSQHYRTFGFDPDYLLHNPHSLQSWTVRFFGGDYEKQLEFYHFYYVRTLAKHPARMAQKVISQMAVFYTIGNPSFYTISSIGLGSFYKETVQNLEASNQMPFLPPLRDYRAHCAALTQTSAEVPQPLLIREMNRLLAILYLPILLCVLAVGVVLLFAARLRRDYGYFLGVALLIYSYNFGNCLGTAIVHSLHIRRYSWTQYSFTLLAECIGLYFIVDLGWTWLARSRLAKEASVAGISTTESS